MRTETAVVLVYIETVAKEKADDSAHRGPAIGAQILPLLAMLFWVVAAIIADGIAVFRPPITAQNFRKHIFVICADGVDVRTLPDQFFGGFEIWRAGAKQLDQFILQCTVTIIVGHHTHLLPIVYHRRCPIKRTLRRYCPDGLLFSQK